MSPFKVKKDEEGLSLLEFIQKRIVSDHSNKEIKRRIENNCCTLNGVVERVASKKVAFGDSVEWDDSFKEKEIVFEPTRILFEDADLLIYNKPPGISCDQEGMIRLLKPKGRLFLVHRLDKYTSGVLVLAKNRETEKALLEAFKKREVEKYYLALCDGVPRAKEGVIENYLGKVGSYQGQTLYGSVPSHLGKYAKTVWTLKKAYKNASLIACYPETGRTHQIRVHLSELGHPILGDYQYGKHFRCPLKPPRMLLHAYELIINHLGKRQKFKAPIPKDFV